MSGSGNVAIYAAEKATELGAVVIAMCDSNGYIVDKNGVDVATIKEIKEVRRARIREYVDTHPQAEYHEGWQGIRTVPCDIALPCATQNEIDLEAAQNLLKNGCWMVTEGSNMPSTLEAMDRLHRGRHPVRAQQGRQRRRRGRLRPGDEPEQPASDLDLRGGRQPPEGHHVQHLQELSAAAEEFGKTPEDYILGANVAAFIKVADAMMAQGLV